MSTGVTKAISKTTVAT